MGPLWDLDLGFGNIGYALIQGLADHTAATGYQPTGWHYERNLQYLYPDVTLWYGRLLSDPWFHNKLVRRFLELRQPDGLWNDAVLHKTVTDLTNQLDSTGAAARHFQRWGTLCWEGGVPDGCKNDQDSGGVGPGKGGPCTNGKCENHCHGIWPYYPPQQSFTTFAAYRDAVLSFMTKRLAWMDKQFCKSGNVVQCFAAKDSVLLKDSVPLMHTVLTRGSLCPVSAVPSSSLPLLDKQTDQCGSNTFRSIASTCVDGQCCSECYGPWPDHPNCAARIAFWAGTGPGSGMWRRSQADRDNLCSNGVDGTLCSFQQYVATKENACPDVNRSTTGFAKCIGECCIHA